MEAFGGVEVEQWWSTMVDSGGAAVLGKLEAWCGGGGARLKPGSERYARVKGKP